MEEPAIELRDVTARYPAGRLALEGICFDVRAGELCVVLGPNGAGKSTLVRVLSGALRPARGEARLLGRPLAGMDRRAIARCVAVVPQGIPSAPGFTVREVVMMGRAPHQGAWMRASGRDEEAVLRALGGCDLLDLSGRPVAELSGGEQKRVAIARALAQEARVLILDEPGAHLDIRHAIEVHEVVRREVAERRLACVTVLHDLNAAAQYADRVALLKDGRLLAHGAIEEVMTYRRLKDAFDAELYVGVNELDGSRYFLPVRGARGPSPAEPERLPPQSRPPERRDL
ncbi:iron ABC transporter ATP-binding protein [Sorangium cellulosum]|uniref:Iron ABC transporter ATP-binding protein n=1 Tax=Sorangium cellulosum TaxID=56 RepID=A0A2L0F777_SORCE|nr:ABC transporter ATP-binding protein [Sorangium cellulosum]AUX47377.1 iron ABC transporter ATP-binding protein [Sorangium cellulosum]